MTFLADSFFKRNGVFESRATSACVLLIAVIVSSPIPSRVLAQTTLRARSQLLSAEVPFSFPERIVVGGNGSLYILDTNLSTLFSLDPQSGKLKHICGSEALTSPSDIALDRKGSIWVLSSLRSKIVKLSQECRVQAEVVSRKLPLKIATNRLGEVIVLNGTGEDLFDLYGPDGKLLRTFGKRLDYKDQATNTELSDGHIAPDRSGGFFFSFNYPPLIRHYGRQGNLIGEFKPESDVAIAPPDVSVRKQGNSTVVRARYQILVLDMAVDAQGRLYLLLSGKNRVPALTEGTQKLVVVAGTGGKVLRTAVLENNFHRVALGNGSLYLLRNRAPLRLDAYAMLSR